MKTIIYWVVVFVVALGFYALGNHHGRVRYTCSETMDHITVEQINRVRCYLRGERIMCEVNEASIESAKVTR